MDPSTAAGGQLDAPGSVQADKERHDARGPRGLVATERYLCNMRTDRLCAGVRGDRDPHIRRRTGRRC